MFRRRILGTQFLSPCDSIKDKESRIDCKFERLHSVTTEQDHVNLDLMRDLNDDKDPRWLPIHIIDNANALILELSQNPKHPDMSYINEKINALDAKILQLRWQQPK